MIAKTKILIVENDPNDIELIHHELKKGGINYVSEIVQNEKEYVDALKIFIPDIILSDYWLPYFTGHAAFKIKEQITPDTPFVFVSGTIGEEKAVELIKNGATDYALKDKLFSLPQKITRALKNAREEKEKKITDEKLIKSNHLYAFISQINQKIVRIQDQESLFRNACQIAIEFGKFKIAWIGIFDKVLENISLMDQSGIPPEDIRLFNNIPYQKNDPQDQVLRTGKYYICNDIEHEPGLETWRPFAAKHGICSYMVLPILKSGKIIGTFNLYSSQLNFLGNEEIDLLIEVTGDISFALDKFEKIKIQKETDELIVQNEIQKEFDKNNLYALINNTKDLMWSVDRNFNLITSNQPFDESGIISFGKAIEKGSNVLEVSYTPEMMQHFKQLYERAFAGEAFTEIEHFNLFWLEISYYPIRKGGEIIGSACHSRDITEIRKTEEKIKESEAKYRSLVEQASDAIIVIEADGSIIEANTSCEKLLGYAKEALLTMKLNDLLFQEDIKANPPRAATLLKGEKIVYEKRMKKRSNTAVEVEVSATKTQEGRTVGIIRDISERKKAEEEAIKSATQIRNFAKHLNHVQEEERAHIAREIHDELGQELVGIKIGLSSFMKNSSLPDQTVEKVKVMMSVVDTAIQSLRKIATQLRPGILDTLGLIPALEWLAKEFERKTKVKCETEMNVVEQKFEKNISICFFRICQESLTNISKHAESDKVIIRLSQDQNELVLKIIDNGKGMSEEKLKNPFSMGLLGMSERASNIGGHLSIRSKKDEGTTIQLTAPVQ